MNQKNYNIIFYSTQCKITMFSLIFEISVPSPAHKTPSDYMEGILFGINEATSVTNITKPVDNDESPPPLPLRQPRVVRPPVSLLLL